MKKLLGIDTFVKSAPFQFISVVFVIFLLEAFHVIATYLQDKYLSSSDMLHRIRDASPGQLRNLDGSKIKLKLFQK